MQPEYTNRYQQNPGYPGYSNERGQYGQPPQSYPYNRNGTTGPQNYCPTGNPQGGRNPPHMGNMQSYERRPPVNRQYGKTPNNISNADCRIAGIVFSALSIVTIFMSWIQIDGGGISAISLFMMTDEKMPIMYLPMLAAILGSVSLYVHVYEKDKKFKQIAGLGLLILPMAVIASIYSVDNVLRLFVSPSIGLIICALCGTFIIISSGLNLNSKNKHF
jgi:hypothetical protein